MIERALTRQKEETQCTSLLFFTTPTYFMRRLIFASEGVKKGGEGVTRGVMMCLIMWNDKGGALMPSFFV